MTFSDKQIFKSGIKYDELRVKYLIIFITRMDKKQYYEELYSRCYPLINYCIKYFLKNYSLKNGFVTKQDLFNTSILAVEMSVRNFDFSKKVKFSTYMIKNVNYYIYNFISKNVYGKNSGNINIDDVLTQELFYEEKILGVDNLLSECKCFLSIEEYNILWRKLSDYTFKDIITEFDLSSREYYLIIETIYNKIKEYLNA